MIMVIKKNNMGFLVGFTMAYTMIAKIIIRAKKPSNRCRIVLRCFIGSDQKATLAHAVKNRLYWSHIGRKIIHFFASSMRKETVPFHSIMPAKRAH